MNPEVFRGEKKNVWIGTWVTCGFSSKKRRAFGADEAAWIRVGRYVWEKGIKYLVGECGRTGGRWQVGVD